MNIVNPYEGSYDDDYFERLHKLNKTGNNLYRENQRLETIEKLCNPAAADDVLELGCGTGVYCRMLSPRVNRIVGVDYSAATIERAIAQGKEDNMEFLLADIQNLGMFPAKTFDKIISIDVLEHLSDDQLESAFHEVVRLLKTNGVFVFFTPCRSHWIEQLKDKNIILKQFEEHIGVRSEAEYREIIRRLNLEVKQVFHFETCLPVLRVVERILKDVPLMGPAFVSRLGMSVTHSES